MSRGAPPAPLHPVRGRGGLYHRMTTSCALATPPPPRRPATPAGPLQLSTILECRAHVPGGHRQHRCIQCVGRGGLYHG